MIHLTLTNKNAQEEIWQSKLKEWCVAHKLTVDSSLEEPVLLEKDRTYKGIAAIDQFLYEYKSFMDDWYDCRCDKWMDQDPA